MTTDEALRERQVVALERIATSLEQVHAYLAGLGVAAEACDHPVAKRTTLGGVMGHPHWRCDPEKGGCGYEHQG